MDIPGQRKLSGGVSRQGLKRLRIRTVVVYVGQEGVAQNVRCCAVQIDRLFDTDPGIAELLLGPLVYAVAKEKAVFAIRGEVWTQLIQNRDILVLLVHLQVINRLALIRSGIADLTNKVDQLFVRIDIHGLQPDDFSAPGAGIDQESQQQRYYPKLCVNLQDGVE